MKKEKSNDMPKGLERVKVEARSNGVLVGTGHINVPTEDEAGLAYLKEHLTLSDVKAIRRQRITNKQNAIRQGYSKTALARRALAGEFGAAVKRQFEDLLKGLE